MNVHINKESNVPLYLQLLAIFSEKIRTGEWPVGEKIQSEKELSRQYNVSLITVRRALEELCALDMINKIQGKGSFVSYGKTEQYNIRFRELSSFTHEMEQSKQKAGAAVLEESVVPASKELADLFGVAPQTRLFRVVRLRTINEIPAIVSTSYIHPEAARKIQGTDLTGSIYAVLERAGIELSGGSEEIFAAMPPANVAQHLGIGDDCPVLDARCKVLHGQKVILFTQSYINSKRLSITVELNKAVSHI